MTRIQITGQRIWGYTIGILGLRKDDVWLPSFPKAGSTWVRFILCNVISLSELDGREINFHVLDATLPELGRNDLLNPWPYKTVPRFVKTHQPYRPLLFILPGRTVYMLRDPRDVMVSYYHFQQAHLWQPFQGSFAEFIRHPNYGLDACIRHHLSWLPHTTFVMRYEALRENTVAELGRMLSSLGVSVRDEFLQLAVERSTFEKMRAVEEKTGISRARRFTPQFRTVRKGTSKQWPDYFSDEDFAFYEWVCDKHRFDLYP